VYVDKIIIFLFYWNLTFVLSSRSQGFVSQHLMIRSGQVTRSKATGTGWDTGQKSWPNAIFGIPRLAGW